MDTVIHARRSGLRNKIHAAFVEFGDRRARYRLYRQTLGELSTLSPRELADMGLHGSMIEAVAREAAYGK